MNHHTYHTNKYFKYNYDHYNNLLEIRWRREILYVHFHILNNNNFNNNDTNSYKA